MKWTLEWTQDGPRWAKTFYPAYGEPVSAIVEPRNRAYWRVTLNGEVYPDRHTTPACAMYGARQQARAMGRKEQFWALLSDRDGPCCWYCQEPLTAGTCTLDHLIPRSILPGWELWNLVLSCEPCNSKKGDRLIQEILRPGFGPGLTPRLPVAA